MKGVQGVDIIYVFCDPYAVHRVSAIDPLAGLYAVHRVETIDPRIGQTALRSKLTILLVIRRAEGYMTVPSFDSIP